MTILVLLVGVVLAVSIVAGAFRLPNPALRAGSAALALVVLFVAVLVSSIRYVGEGLDRCRDVVGAHEPECTHAFAVPRPSAEEIWQRK